MADSERRTSRFAQALAAQAAPRRLGDVSLRYEPSLLIGETHRALRSAAPTVAASAGLVSLVLAVGLFLLRTPTWTQALAIAVTGGCYLAARLLDARDKRRRAFILNFVTYTLRLDFVTPVAGHARTLLVPFSGVRGLHALTQADGRTCLTVDFEDPQRPDVTLREVLAAHIGDDEAEALARLTRVLEGALGLRVPDAQPGEAAHPPESAPTDLFEDTQPNPQSSR